MQRLQLVVGFLRMADGANGNGVPVVGPQTFGGAEVQLGPGGVDQEIVSDVFLHAGLVRRGVLDGHERLGIFRIAFRMDRQRLGLAKIHIGFAVQLGEVESDILLGHLAHAHPDVGGYPVPFCIGRNHDDLVLLAYPFVEVSGGGMPGYTRAQNYDSRHFLSFCNSPNPNRPLIEFVTL